MTDPTPLSPAAQAVLDSVKEICPAPADEIAATALRAAADHLDYIDSLYEIATELEAQ